MGVRRQPISWVVLTHSKSNISVCSPSVSWQPCVWRDGIRQKREVAFMLILPQWTRNTIFCPIVAHAKDAWGRGGENAICLQSLSITPRIAMGYNTCIMRVPPGLSREAIRVTPGSLLDGWLLEAGDCNLWHLVPP